MSMTTKEMTDARTREWIASHPFERQRVTALFILKTCQLASGLDKMATLVSVHGAHLTDEVKDSMSYIESKIRECYRESFGAELGSIKLDDE